MHTQQQQTNKNKIMKHLLLLLGLGLALTSCQKDHYLDELNAEKEKNVQLSSQLSTTKSDLVNATNDLNNTATQLTTINVMLDGLTEDHSDLNVQFADLTADYNAAVEQVAALTLELANSSDDNDALIAQIIELQETIAELRDAIDALQTEISNFNTAARATAAKSKLVAAGFTGFVNTDKLWGIYSARNVVQYHIKADYQWNTFTLSIFRRGATGWADISANTTLAVALANHAEDTAKYKPVPTQTPTPTPTPAPVDVNQWHYDLVSLGWIRGSGNWDTGFAFYHANSSYPNWSLVTNDNGLTFTVKNSRNDAEVIANGVSDVASVINGFVAPATQPITWTYTYGPDMPVDSNDPNTRYYNRVTISVSNPSGTRFRVRASSGCNGGVRHYIFSGSNWRDFGYDVQPNYGRDFSHSYNQLVGVTYYNISVQGVGSVCVGGYTSKSGTIR